MSLRAQALLEFDLPVAPTRVDELAAALAGDEALRVHSPAGRFLLLCSGAPLVLAFEATLFDLLAESRFPAPAPRRSSSGSFVARLKVEGGPVRGASCYAWPPGEPLEPQAAAVPQLLEVGRLCARLHQLAEAHPASVADPAAAETLSSARAAGKDGAGPEIAAVLEAGLPRLPIGAVHGGLGPARVLFLGERCSAVLPGGRACAAPLLLDVAEAIVSWALCATRAAAAMRAFVSGYQALRRFAKEERESLFGALRYAAAREGARRLRAREPEPLAPLRAADALGEAEVRAAAG